ncbi:unnamed protein product [Pieris brassicae]|uniref:Uncharacterized protein n=1 Tax=Pieris brassicae TaxID=7116 RepID=A0A9P0TEV9_PIEBR|nr:unnamed protein product [Pieris brassicae]
MAIREGVRVVATYPVANTIVYCWGRGVLYAPCTGLIDIIPAGRAAGGSSVKSRPSRRALALRVMGMLENQSAGWRASD